ncbi:MAG: hypothetical protein QW478_04450 [Candidatus Micrarchaeaceae archaeon]
MIPKHSAQAFIMREPSGHRDFAFFQKSHAFANIKRTFGSIINKGTLPDNPWEILFKVELYSCNREVPVFLVRDHKV